jgi:hypothetical protein
MRTKESHNLQSGSWSAKKAGTVFQSESPGLRNTRPDGVPVRESLSPWEKGGCWCQSQRLKTWEPEASVSKGRRRWIWQLKGERASFFPQPFCFCWTLISWIIFVHCSNSNANLPWKNPHRHNQKKMFYQYLGIPYLSQVDT